MGACISEKKQMTSNNLLRTPTNIQTYQINNHNVELNQKKQQNQTVRIQKLVNQPDKEYKKVLAEKDSNLVDLIDVPIGQSEVKQHGSRTNVLVHQPTEKEYLQYIKCQLQGNSSINLKIQNQIVHGSMYKSGSSGDSSGLKKQKQWQKSEQNTKQSKIVKELMPADPQQSCVNIRLSNSHLNIAQPQQNIVSRINIQV